MREVKRDSRENTTKRQKDIEQSLINVSQPCLRVKQEVAILTLNMVFARNCVILPGRAGCDIRQKRRTHDILGEMVQGWQ